MKTKNKKTALNTKKTNIFLNQLLAEKNILKNIGKIQSVQFPASNNISKIHENRRQKSASGIAGIIFHTGMFSFLKMT